MLENLSKKGSSHKTVEHEDRKMYFGLKNLLLARPVVPNLCAAAHQCAARCHQVCRKNIKVKFNQVRFKKFHAANVSQYGTLTILLVVIELFLVGECFIQVYLRLNKVRCVAALCKIMHEINSDWDIYKH